MRTPFVQVGLSLAAAPAGTVVPLDDDTVHHLARVLRRAPGDELELSDGKGWTVPAVLGDATATTQAHAVSHPAERPSITVLHAVPKGRLFDEIVRTCTELGVASIVPVVAERSVVRPSGARAVAAVDRWQAVADAAAAQARRAHRCEVAAVAPLRAAATATGETEARLVAHPDGAVALGAALRSPRVVDRVVVAIGPEGGFSDQEIATLNEMRWTDVHAGRSILRTAHAGPVLVTAVQALTGRFDDG